MPSTGHLEQACPATLLKSYPMPASTQTEQEIAASDEAGQTAFVSREEITTEIVTDTLDLTPPDPRTRYWRIQSWRSDALPTPRDLFVHLPKAYLLQPERAFPVLLLHDGQNLFDGDLSYLKGSTWRCGETADEEANRGTAQPVILLGIGNTGIDRMAEYTPTADTRLGGGNGPRYAELLVQELLPRLRRDLRLLPGPQHTGIAGSSLGGLISLAIGLQYPQIFGKVGVLSPSIWWNKRAILDEVRALQGKLPLRIWLDMGTAEGQVHLRDADLLAHLLHRKGWRLDADPTPPKPAGLRRLASPLERDSRPDASAAPDLHYYAAPDLHYERVLHGLHTEAAWAARFGQALRFLFPA